MSDDQQNAMAIRTRDTTGRFIRSLEGAERDAEAARLRAQGWTYREIGTALDVAPSNAHAAVQRALLAAVEEPADMVRQFELERLDAVLVRLDGYEAAARAVLARKHVTVSQGKVIQLPDEAGKLVPLEDDAPVLNAIDRLVKIEDARLRVQERRARLLGLDAPTKAEVGGKLSYEIVGVNLEAL